MNEKKMTLRFGFQHFLVYLPLAAAVGAGFLPLRPVVQQALIGIVILWLYMSCLLGLIS